MNMMKWRDGIRPLTLRLVLVLMIAGAIPALAASSEADFKAAYVAAEAANKEAGALRNPWTTTVATLADAKAAADKGDTMKPKAKTHAHKAKAKKAAKPAADAPK